MGMRTIDRAILVDLNVFATIVRRGSMGQAAIELGVTTSALSHRLRKLEAELGVKLLNRSSRSIHPTEAGKAFAAALNSGFEAISDALTSLERHRQFPVGRLRMNALRDGARLVLGPIQPRYFETCPDIHLDVTVDDRFIDLVAEGFDAGIRYRDRVPMDMVCVDLTPPVEWVVVGSPEFIARKGRPERPQDLMDFPCVQMRVGDNSHFPWELGNGDSMIRLDVRGPISANETEHSVDASLRGVGFAYCLERRVRSEVAAGALEIVLPDWSSGGPPFSIYYPSRRQTPPGLRQLIDIVRDNEGLPPLVAVSADPL